MQLRNAIGLFLRVLLFFPSITFSLLAAEVFPWAGIYGVYKKAHIKRILFPIIIILSTISVFSFFIARINGHDTDVLRSFMAYLNPLMVFTAILSATKLERVSFYKLIKWILFFLTIIGIAQYLKIIGFLQPLFSLLIPRGTTESFGGLRGVLLLSSEPSYAAVSYVFLYSLFRRLYIKNGINKLLVDLFVSFFILLIIKSAVGFIFLALFLLINYRLKFVLVTAIGALLVLGFLLSLSEESRALALLVEVFQNSDVSTVYKLIFDQSGFRLISILSSYYSGFVSHPFGHGIGLWMTSSVQVMYEFGIPPSEISFFRDLFHGVFIPIRPTSYFANLMLDIGVIGSSVFFFFLFRMVRGYKHLIDVRNDTVILFLFYFFLSGTVGDPIPWLCLGLRLVYEAEKMDIRPLDLGRLKITELFSEIKTRFTQ